MAVIGLAPRLRVLRAASPSPFRGQHRWPGKAGSAAFLELSTAIFRIADVLEVMEL
jgi:hypothetical protein